MTRTAGDSMWGSDVRISMPHPLSEGVSSQVDFGGLGFTGNGLVHNFSEVDREELMASGFAPPEEPQNG